MSTMVAELYDALRQAGVEQELARRAASAVLAVDARMDLATKSDLLALKADLAELKLATKADLVALRIEIQALRTEFRADLADTKAELIKWNVGAMAVLTGIFAAIVRLG